MRFNYDKTKTYLLACSFGPDSMALLNMLLEKGIRPIVCHVNYHRRPESNAEQNNLEKFCSFKNLELKVFDTTGIEPKGNFQAWAREIRYRFFQNIYEKNDASGIFIAHQEDDAIETYFIQKARKSLVLYYGIAEETMVMGMNILRPLLHDCKASLKTYCETNSVPFSIDSSNLTDHYLRNRIRHRIVQTMTLEERKNTLSEISTLNLELSKRMLTLDTLFKPYHELSIVKLITLNDDDFGLLLFKFIGATIPALPLSKKRVAEIQKICLSVKPNIDIPLGRKWILAKRYDCLKILPKSDHDGYSYTLNRPGILNTPYFLLDFSNESSLPNISQEDYPLTIRTYLAGDEIQIGKMIKRINRLYIDWKMPSELRKRWPIILSCHGKPIYVPRYSAGYLSHPNSNFQVK